MLHRLGHACGTHGGQGGGGICVAQFRDQSHHLSKIVAVEGLGRNTGKVWLGQKQLQRARLYLALGRDRAARIKGHAQTRLHQIVDRRIGRPGVKGQQSSVILGPRNPRINPGNVANAAQVQKCHRRIGAKPLGTGEMKERGQRRALPAQFNIGRAEIPHHRHAKRIRERRPIAQLQGALRARRMGHGLAMKSDQINGGKLAQEITMGLHHHIRGRAQNVAMPVPQRRMQYRPLLR
mmetsp:Transcript_11759/g.18912  ORF Transcript_11759/g.18912 Transcript_11759/m.18912 type:complete len:236 (-) Transcript_11759:162-869(-)